ncbi:hypothetical protein GCM10027321_14830 [Massilia terrae]|uniref:Uncharacterized protein n=1 Tax=Massilia terrae TaxID=1811224 RepID=A0ABT2CUL8_9BURK|nr:hypothetical protein [Massilia terrae]MCS0657673.1 hypothetical protein [Massilia terrae]
MRLPGTRYQEPGWEQVRKLLGQCSLHALAQCDVGRLVQQEAQYDTLGDYVDLCADALRASARASRAQAPGNSYGETVFELALTLLYELQARPADWAGMCAAVVGEYRRLGPFWLGAGADGLLRKKVNDMYAGLRDKVDSDNYQAACGRPCSPNRMYAFRMLDTARGEIARLFDGWDQHREQVGAILGREIGAEPIEARLLRGGGACKAEWVIAWSESLERFTDSSGPLHTRSKRFASLKTSPAKIDAMLAEIAEYERMSANRDGDWRLDSFEATGWLDDYARVLADSQEAASPGPDQILEARQDELAQDAREPEEGSAAERDDEPVPERGALSLPPRFAEVALSAAGAGAWAERALARDSMPVRLAVYLKLIGPADDCYPAEWLDPATGELPVMQQLALLDRISLPTLRKRRDAAIERLATARR